MKTITYTLKDIASYITDGKHGDCMDQDDSGFYFISSKDVNGDEINYQDARQITENDFLETNKRTRYEPNDILLTNSGTIGRMAIAKDIAETKRTTFQKSVAIIKPNKYKVLPLWLYYYLKANIYILGDIASGAAQKNLLLKDIRAFKVNVPECAIQKSIITMLSPYYDIIEKNNRRIQLLEEAARLLFREWFVYFRFPGHEKVKIVDGVPEGWVKGLLEDSAIVKKGKNITFEHAVEGDIPVVGGGLGPTYYHNKANVSAPVITISASGANAGYVNMYDTDIWASDCSYIDKNSTKYVYSLYLKLKSLQTTIFGFQVGVAQPHVYPRDLNRLKLLIAPDDLCMQFEQLVTPIFNLIKNLKLGNQKLAQARDLLLPRLMSGKIDPVRYDKFSNGVEV